MTDIITIPLNRLTAWDGNVRRTGAGDGIEELAASIAAHGLLQSLLVKKTKDGRYAVIAGRRRGLREALPAYEPLTAERHADALTAVCLDAFARMATDDPTALPAFATLLGQAGSDGLVSFHLKRLLAGNTGIVVTLE